jgi:hypothetical protein
MYARKWPLAVYSYSSHLWPWQLHASLGGLVLHPMKGGYRKESTSDVEGYQTTTINYSKTSGFWPRVRARALRAPVLLGTKTRPTGRYAPPYPSQLRCFLFTPPKLSLRPELGPPGAFTVSFHWAKLHPIELYIASY